MHTARAISSCVSLVLCLFSGRGALAELAAQSGHVSRTGRELVTAEIQAQRFWAADDLPREALDSIAIRIDSATSLSGRGFRVWRARALNESHATRYLFALDGERVVRLAGFSTIDYEAAWGLVLKSLGPTSDDLLTGARTLGILTSPWADSSIAMEMCGEGCAYQSLVATVLAREGKWATDTVAVLPDGRFAVRFSILSAAMGYGSMLWFPTRWTMIFDSNRRLLAQRAVTREAVHR